MVNEPTYRGQELIGPTTPAEREVKVVKRGGRWTTTSSIKAEAGLAPQTEIISAGGGVVTYKPTPKEQAKQQAILETTAQAKAGRQLRAELGVAPHSKIVQLVPGQRDILTRLDRTQPLSYRQLPEQAMISIAGGFQPTGITRDISQPVVDLSVKLDKPRAELHTAGTMIKPIMGITYEPSFKEKYPDVPSMALGAEEYYTEKRALRTSVIGKKTGAKEKLIVGALYLGGEISRYATGVSSFVLHPIKSTIEFVKTPPQEMLTEFIKHPIATPATMFTLGKIGKVGTKTIKYGLSKIPKKAKVTKLTGIDYSFAVEYTQPKRFFAEPLTPISKQQFLFDIETSMWKGKALPKPVKNVYFKTTPGMDLQVTKKIGWADIEVIKTDVAVGKINIKDLKLSVKKTKGISMEQRHYEPLLEPFTLKAKTSKVIKEAVPVKGFIRKVKAGVEPTPIYEFKIPKTTYTPAKFIGYRFDPFFKDVAVKPSVRFISRTVEGKLKTKDIQLKSIPGTKPRVQVPPGISFPYIKEIGFGKFEPMPRPYKKKLITAIKKKVKPIGKADIPDIRKLALKRLDEGKPLSLRPLSQILKQPEVLTKKVTKAKKKPVIKVEPTPLTKAILKAESITKQVSRVKFIPVLTTRIKPKVELETLAEQEQRGRMIHKPFTDIFQEEKGRFTFKPIVGLGQKTGQDIAQMLIPKLRTKQTTTPDFRIPGDKILKPKVPTLPPPIPSKKIKIPKRKKKVKFKRKPTLFAPQYRPSLEAIELGITTPKITKRLKRFAKTGISLRPIVK